MKDKKFAILCILGVIWLLLFIAVGEGIRPLRNVWYMVSAIGVCWFAYWTVSFIRSKPSTEQPTKTTQTNAKSKKTPKSE